MSEGRTRESTDQRYSKSYNIFNNHHQAKEKRHDLQEPKKLQFLSKFTARIKTSNTIAFRSTSKEAMAKKQHSTSESNLSSTGKINSKMEKKLQDNFEKFKYGYLPKNEFKKTLLKAVNFPEANQGYFKKSKDSKSKSLPALTSELIVQEDDIDIVSRGPQSESDVVSVRSEPLQKEENEAQQVLKKQMKALHTWMADLKLDNDRLRGECHGLEKVLHKQKEDFEEQKRIYIQRSVQYTDTAKKLHDCDEQYFELKKKLNFQQHLDNKQKNKLLQEVKKDKREGERREEEILEYWEQELFDLQKENEQLEHNQITELQEQDSIIEDNMKVIREFKAQLDKLQTSGYDDADLLNMDTYKNLKSELEMNFTPKNYEVQW